MRNTMGDRRFRTHYYYLCSSSPSLSCRLSRRTRIPSYYVLLSVLLLLLILCQPVLATSQINEEEIGTRRQTDDTTSTPEAVGGGLCWRNLSITTAPSSSRFSSTHHGEATTISTRIVHECSGYVPNGHVCGVLGPSGSGKTSFLAALAAGSSTSSSETKISATGSSSLYVHGDVYLYREQSQQRNADSKNEEDADTTLSVSLSKQDVAMLQQEDEFFAMLTVEETLQLAAFLELPHSTHQQRQERVEEQLATLGLAHVAHRRVGSNTRGSSTTGGGGGSGGGSSSSAFYSSALRNHLDIDDLESTNQTQKKSKKQRRRQSATGTTGSSGGRLSGGERRRLSIALELLTHDKKLLLADESTTGLDSTMSRQVMSLLQRMARLNNIPALCTLHQPQSYIYWHYLDDILLMAPGGYVVYAGPRQDCLSYFAKHTKSTSHGPYFCPDRTNPAEFLVDLVSIDTEDAQQAHEDWQRIQELTQCFAEYQKQKLQELNRQHKYPSPFKAAPQHATIDNDHSLKVYKRGRRLVPKLAPLLRHWGLLSRRWLALLRRSWRQNIRNAKANAFRFITSAGTAILLSMVFYPTIGGAGSARLPTANSVADRAALLTFGAVNMFFMAFLKTITLISEEQPVVHREQTRQQYSSLEYLMAKIVAELPLDTLFASVFTTVLKLSSGVRISWRLITATFSLLTISGAALGFMLGSWFQDVSMAASSPVVVVLMVVGVINPGGIDASSPPPPAPVRWLKRCSPFAFAVEALCLGEYTGMELSGLRDGLWGRLKDLPRMGAFAMVQNGDQVIEALGLKGKTYQGVMQSLGRLSIYYLALTWVGLQVMGQHSNWPAAPTTTADDARQSSSGHSKAVPPDGDRVLLRNKESLSEMSAFKVPPRGW